MMQTETQSDAPVTESARAHPSTTEQAGLYSWYVVLLCMVAYIFSFIDRQILALMIEPIKADLHISDTQFSLLHGLAFSLFYAFMGLPLAYLADRFSRPKLIAIGVVFWSIATVACGLSKNFIHLFLSRVGVGVGEAALSPAAYSMFSDMFSKEKLGRAVAVYFDRLFCWRWYCLLGRWLHHWLVKRHDADFSACVWHAQALAIGVCDRGFTRCVDRLIGVAHCERP